MFGIGSTELLVILVVALIVLGPKSLASFSRTLGKAVGEFRRVSTDFQRTLNAEAAADDAKKAAKKKTPANDAPSSDSGRPADSAKQDIPMPPPDSPIGQALAKAKAEAEKPQAATCGDNPEQPSSHGV